jgi:hypothetical protein
MRKALFTSLLLLLPAATSTSVWAAELPAHSPFSLLIIADEVNPHRLSDPELTQPEDLQPALAASKSALNLSAVSTVDSQCIDAALDALASANAPDVVLYFAHRAARHCDGSDAEPTLTQLLGQGLQQGVGVVVLHHGLFGDFTAPGAKDPLLQVLGARTNSIAWDTTAGQRVFNTGGDHFVSSNGLNYAQQAHFAGTAGVAADSYPYFVNLPDELYPDTELFVQEGEDRDILFATDSQGERVLGYALQRPDWQGRVVAYQPGEYQPGALDDSKGPNFQILVNALYFVAQD